MIRAAGSLGKRVGHRYYFYIVPTINFTEDEHAAVTAAVRRTMDEDRYPHSPRLAPLRAALGEARPSVGAQANRAATAAADRPSFGNRRAKARR